jgi:hypothetical protein
MEEDRGWLEAQCLELHEHLARLDSGRLAGVLSQARLDVLSFAAGGAGIARRVLLIEQASRDLVETFPLQDPTTLDDARTVRASSVRAVEQMNQVLALVCDWLEHPPADPRGTERAVRSVLHAFNNVLVGINCYAELLVGELQEGDPCHAALVTISQEGAAISRLVRERVALQHYLNELFQAAPSQAHRLERQTLLLLLGTLGLRVALAPEFQGQFDAAQIAQALDALPPAERQILVEALRRIESSPD